MSGISKTPKLSIEQLKGEQNYLRWIHRLQVQTLAIQYHGEFNYWDMANNKYVPDDDVPAENRDKPTETNLVTNVVKKIGTNQRVIPSSDCRLINQQLVAMLDASMESTVSEHVRGDMSAYSILTKLKNLYNANNAGNAQNIIGHMFRHKQNNTPVEVYCNQMKLYADQYNELRQTTIVDDQILTSMMIENAERRYDVTIETIKNGDGKRYTYEAVKAAMVAWDTSHPFDSPTTALSAEISKTKFNRFKSKRQLQRKHKDVDHSVMCKHCRRSSSTHNAADCWANPDSKRYRESFATFSKQTRTNKPADSKPDTQAQQRADGLKAGYIADMSDQDNTALLANTIERTTHTSHCELIVDSGASVHLSGNKDILHDFKPMSPSGVQGISNQRMTATGTGNIRIKYMLGDEQIETVIHNVHYIAGVRHNLLSVPTLTDKGMTVKCDQVAATIYCGDAAMMTAYRQRGLYRVNVTAANIIDVLYAAGHQTGLAADTEQAVVEQHTDDSMTNSNGSAVDPAQGSGNSTDGNVNTSGTNIGDIGTDSKELILWHNRFDHVNEKTLLDMSKKGVLEGIPKLSGVISICKSCIHGKQAATPHTAPVERSTRILQLIHIDIGMMGSPGFYTGDEQYFITFIDDYSRYLWVYTMAKKDEAFSKIQHFVNLMNNQRQPLKVSALKTDGGSEFVNSKVTALCSKEGMMHYTTAPHSPQQNGVAERMNRTLKEAVRTKLNRANQVPALWPLALIAAAYVRNRIVGAATNGVTPYELFNKVKPSVKHLRIWGCVAYTMVPHTSSQRALDSRTQEYLFVGYTDTEKNYVLMHPNTYKTTVSNNVKFDESQFKQKSVLPSLATLPTTRDTTSVGESSTIASRQPSQDVAQLQPHVSNGQLNHAEHPHRSSVGELNHEEAPHRSSVGDIAAEQDESSNMTIPQPSDVVMSNEHDSETASADVGRTAASERTEQESARRSSRVSARVNYTISNLIKEHCTLAEAVPMPIMAMLAVDDEPQTFKEAMEGIDGPKWRAAMDSEMKSLYQHHTGDLVKKPAQSDIRILPNRWVYRIKYDNAGQPTKYKARLVVKGFMQRYGFEYIDTYAPAVRISSILVVLAIVAQRDLELHQLDVDTAFLYGDLKEEIYMEQPTGYVDSTHPKHVWKLNKSLYGLKQAPAVWYDQVNDFFVNQLGFNRIDSELGLYVHITDTTYCIICLYVDDMLIACDNIEQLTTLKQQISMQWSIKDLGEAKKILGLSIRRDRAKRMIYVNQSSYIKAVLNKYRMSDCNPSTTPASQEQLKPSTGTEATKPTLERVPYREATGSLIYCCYTRPDIQFAVSQVCKYNNTFTKVHWTAVKRILRYLRATMDHELTFDGNSPLILIGYSDADFANDEITRKSYNGYTMNLGKSLISWSSSQQTITAQSTCEAEFIAMAYALKEMLYLRMILDGLGITQVKPTTLYSDSQSAIALSYNPTHHKHTKHIDIKYHRIRDEISAKHIRLEFVETSQMQADFLTKTLSEFKLRRALELIHMNTNTATQSTSSGSVESDDDETVDC